MATALHTSSRNALLVALTLLIGLAPIGCGSMSPRAHWRHALDVAHERAAPLEIVNANGPVRAVSEDRDDVSIEAELHGDDAERLSFAVLRAERMGDGALRVWVEWPGGTRRSNEGARIDVYTPGAEGVTVTTSNGGITLLGLGGDALAETTNGSIRIDDQRGAVEASTTNGNVRADHPHGPTTIRSSNGRVLVDEADGPVKAETTNGRIVIATAHGNPGPVRARTSNGSITFELGEGFAGRLRAKTSNGRLSLRGFDDPRRLETTEHTLKVQIGDDETESVARTSNGSITIRGRSRGE